MDFNFGEVLSRAWQIIWKHRVLWIFGILASCSRGGGGGNGGGGDRGSAYGGNLPPQFLQFAQWLQQNLMTFFVLVCLLVLVLWLVTRSLGVVGKIGLIRGTAQAEGGSEHLIFGQLFSEGMPYFGRMLGLTALVEFPFIALAMLIAFTAASMVLRAGFGGVNAIAPAMVSLLIPFGLCICLLVPLLIVISLIAHQSERAILFEQLQVLPALSRGWDVFRNNLGPILIMAVILGVLGVVAGFIVALPVLVVVFPFLFAYALGNSQNAAPFVLMAICICLYLPVLLVLRGILVAYTESVWTLTYMRLTGKPASSDIVPPDSGAPPTPPTIDDGDKTIISSSHA